MHFLRFGGSDGHTLLNDIWCFDLSSHLWTNINALGYVPSPREGASIAYADGAIYLFGGRGTDGQALGDLCAYRIYSEYSIQLITIRHVATSLNLPSLMARQINDGICSKTWARLLLHVTVTL